MSLVVSSVNQRHDLAIEYISNNWREEFEVMAVEVLYFSDHQSAKFKLLEILQDKTDKKYGIDFNKWYEYLWSKPQVLTLYYHEFKARLHGFIDKRFVKYFKNRQKISNIRLDEVRWGGVIQDGIPPLRNPQMISADDATYLDGDNIVFGIEINGDFRAYPKRILAWHEMFTDTVGGIPVAGVYCTLCGTVILYKTEQDGKKYELGTSGFLYRSNKLMYDKETQSLWNTLWGKPVIGPLVDKGIELDYLSVVTTTWKDWKARHPETTVLSLKTGYNRNYGEGVAYNDYFSTDNLMFNVPEIDKSLKNKQSVLALRLPDVTDESIAISTKFLRKNNLYKGEIADKNFVVLTDKSGANRVYFSENVEFINYNQKSEVVDTSGIVWKLHENYLKSSTGKTLKRLNSFNAFWFGWKAAHPNTKLIK
ncbi:MAG: DUF3179 domain-containing protein [Winogradskyella sp.]|nr:MAG: DUF3179 domain-containing protein [Winogradskyella sp.]